MQMDLAMTMAQSVTSLNMIWIGCKNKFVPANKLRLKLPLNLQDSQLMQ